MIVLRSTRMSREGNKSCLLTKPQHPAVISGMIELSSKKTSQTLARHYHVTSVTIEELSLSVSVTCIFLMKNSMGFNTVKW